MDHQSSRKCVLTGSANFPGAGLDRHGRSFEAHLGEKLSATETEQEIVRHLEWVTGQKEYVSE